MNIRPTNLPEEGVIGIDEMSITYTQKPDCLQDSDEQQTLTVTAAIDMPSEDEDDLYGWFFRIKTGESGWSVNNAEEIREILKDAINRLFNRSNETI